MAALAEREAFCGAGLELRPSNKAEHFTISRHASPRGGFLFHALRFFAIVGVLVRFDHAPVKE